MQKIVPNIWCRGAALEAATFYEAAFPGATTAVTGHYPETGLPDWQQAFAGEPVTVDVVIDGFRLTLINAGGEFRPNPAISFMLNADPLRFGGDVAAARTWIDERWASLSVGGEVRMALGSYPFSAHYGWVEDRYGVNWQLMLTDPDGAPRPPVLPALLFSGRSEHRAAEAIATYTSLFERGAVGTTVQYPTATGPANAGDIMFADFTLDDVWIVAMDSGSPDVWEFTPGVSLEVHCRNQEEIDRYWDALSAVPDAEQCGWLVDQFGVSWQIVPENMGELMARPGAFGRMLQMRRIIIDDL